MTILFFLGKMNAGAAHYPRSSNIATYLFRQYAHQHEYYDHIILYVLRGEQMT